MAYQFITTPISPNLYILQKLNNMNLAKVFNKEHRDWMKYYHKILQGIETMIDIQKQVQDMMKMVEEINTIITKIKRTILQASNNHRSQNTASIFSIYIQRPTKYGAK